MVASTALVEKLLASFPGDVDESMRHKVLDVADEKDVSSLYVLTLISFFFLFLSSCSLVFL